MQTKQHTRRRRVLGVRVRWSIDNQREPPNPHGIGDDAGEDASDARDSHLQPTSTERRHHGSAQRSVRNNGASRTMTDAMCTSENDLATNGDKLMRCVLVLLLVFASVSIASAQRCIPIDNSLLAAEFDRAGDHLFALFADRIEQIRTDDGTVLRQFAIPGADETPREHIRWGTLGLTNDERELILVRPDSRFLILNLDAGPEQAVDQWQTIAVPRDPENRSYSTSTIDMSFYGNLADGRLVFAKGSFMVRRCSELMLYDREAGAFVGLPVELGGHTALSLHPGEESVSAVRLSLIGNPARYVWQSEPNKTERLAIRWNDLGYSSVTVEAEGYVPDAPASISPDLKEYTAQTGRLQATNSGWLISTVGSLRWKSSMPFQQIMPPKPIHQIYHKVLHGGGASVRWSGDSERLFIGGADSSPKPSLTGVSVFNRSGQRIGVLPTGRASFVHVLAVSHDGKRVVTSAGRKQSESTLLWHID